MQVSYSSHILQLAADLVANGVHDPVCPFDVRCFWITSCTSGTKPMFCTACGVLSSWSTSWLLKIQLSSIRCVSGLCDGIWSSVCQREGPGWMPGHAIWDLWWTKWPKDKFLSECFHFSLSVCPPPVLHGSLFIYNTIRNSSNKLKLKAQRAPGGWGSQDFSESLHMKVAVVIPTHRSPLRPGKICGTHFF
jgi:hypothetical protein